MHMLVCVCVYIYSVCIDIYKCVFKCIQVLLTWTSHPRIGLDMCGKHLSRTQQLDDSS